MSNQSSLEAATQDRKARLAHLKSLKRKQPPTEEESSVAESSTDGVSTQELPQRTNIQLSGRNYDAEARDVKLGYDVNPALGQTTLEDRAATIADEAKAQAAEAEKDEKPLDLFKLQPKKPNWDLKRDLERKLEVLNRRTDNAIAKLVRERITNAQAQAKGSNGENGELAGIEGAALVGAMHEREKEAEAEREEEEAEDRELGE